MERVRVLAVAIGLFVLAGIALGDVNVSPYGPPTVTPFPAGSPPGDLPAGEDADARPFVEVKDTPFTGTWDPATNTFTVTTTGDTNVSGHSEIRVPDNASQKLKDHETGHADLDAAEYNKNAKRKVEEALKGFIGQKFTGEGATDAARRADAIKKAGEERDRRHRKAEDAILQQQGTLGKKYDDLTKHGTSDTVDTPTGKKKALEEQAKAPGAGQHSFVPIPSEPFVQTGNAVVTIDPLSQVTEPIVAPLQLSSFPGDPILGAQLVVDPFIVIGPIGNGAIHLSDTSLAILDPISGEPLLHGYLFEAAYLPSSDPAFPFMIQAYLDVPPDFAGGINNTIGSPFLQSYAQSVASGDNTTFWMFLNEPLLDERGQPIGDGSVTGAAVIGVAPPVVPELNEALMIGTGMAAAGLAATRRRTGGFAKPRAA